MSMSNNVEARARAIQWLLSSQRGPLSAAKVQEWEQWIADPRNQEVYERVVEVWSSAGTLEPMSLPDAAELAADDYRGHESVEQWRARRVPEESRRDPCVEEMEDISSIMGGNTDADVSRFEAPRRRIQNWTKWGLAAAATLAVFAWLVLPQLRSTWTGEPRFYETGLAEHRSVTLEDGSEILLGARTSLWVTYTRQRRIIVLDRGEALFDVARDPRRPFSVHAGHGIVTAVGTSFSVRRDHEHVKVTVAEGVVRFEPRAPDAAAGSGAGPVAQSQGVVATLRQGQQVRYDERDSGRVSIVRVDADLESAWRNGRLQYVDEPLRNVIADINRYSRRQIVLEGPHVDTLHFTGIVFQENADQWAGQLPSIFPVLEVVDTDEERVVLRAQRPSGVESAGR